MKSILLLGVAISASAVLSTPTARALTLDYHVDVNTAALIGNPSGPFSLDFQLNDGSGLGDGNNTAIVSGFTFGSGSPLGGAATFGGASGNLAGGVTLVDLTPFNEFYQAFTPGNSLSFDVLLTVNADAGPTPDAFAFAILDNSLMNLPTSGVGDSFLLVNLGQNPSFITGANPSVSINVTAVPEPGVLALLAMSALGVRIATCGWRRKVARTPRM